MKLAINGWEKARKVPFMKYNPIGEDEIKSVVDVMRTWMLSDFLWSPSDKFLWWEKILLLENNWSDLFKVKHSITINSATTGLNAAIYACNIEPFSEIIVSPYTMSASVTCVLANNCIPVFADIDNVDYCLSPESVEKKITSKTKAIVFVNIFWKVWQIEEIMKIAKKYNLFVIEDASQSPLAQKSWKYAWTFWDVWVFSLNIHKHINSWEWWVIVTNNDEIALRLQLYRNHWENFVDSFWLKNISNTVWWNYRLTEIQAAITIEQLKKLKEFVKRRQELAMYLNNRLREFNYISVPECIDGDNSYYLYPLSIDVDKLGVTLDKVVDALLWEWIPINPHYTKPLYLLPVFQERTYMWKNWFLFKESNTDYSYGICPTCERKYEKELVYLEIIHHFHTKDDMDDIYNAFKKIDLNFNKNL